MGESRWMNPPYSLLNFNFRIANNITTQCKPWRMTEARGKNRESNSKRTMSKVTYFSRNAANNVSYVTYLKRQDVTSVHLVSCFALLYYPNWCISYFGKNKFLIIPCFWTAQGIACFQNFWKMKEKRKMKGMHICRYVYPPL